MERERERERESYYYEPEYIKYLMSVVMYCSVLALGRQVIKKYIVV